MAAGRKGSHPMATVYGAEPPASVTVIEPSLPAQVGLTWLLNAKLGPLLLFRFIIVSIKQLAIAVLVTVTEYWPLGRPVWAACAGKLLRRICFG